MTEVDTKPFSWDVQNIHNTNPHCKRVTPTSMSKFVLRIVFYFKQLISNQQTTHLNLAANWGEACLQAGNANEDCKDSLQDARTVDILLILNVFVVN